MTCPSQVDERADLDGGVRYERRGIVFVGPHVHGFWVQGPVHAGPGINVEAIREAPDVAAAQGHDRAGPAGSPGDPFVLERADPGLEARGDPGSVEALAERVVEDDG